MIPQQLRLALYTQLGYAALVVVWQVVGVALMATGRPAQGPTASLAVAFQSIIVGVLYVFALRRSPLLFVLLSLASALAAGGFVTYALTADPTLWMSEPARYLAITLNSVGVFGFLLAVLGYVQWLRARPAPAADLSESITPGAEE